MRGYLASISAATGEPSEGVCRAIEDHMRNDIFHSPLDWQSKRQFRNGARKAYQLWVVMHAEATDEQVIRAYQTKRDREFFRTRSPEVIAEWCVNIRLALKKISKEIAA